MAAGRSCIPGGLRVEDRVTVRGRTFETSELRGLTIGEDELGPYCRQKVWSSGRDRRETSVTLRCDELCGGD